jgi:hypothetical protein
MNGDIFFAERPLNVFQIALNDGFSLLENAQILAAERSGYFFEKQRRFYRFFKPPNGACGRALREFVHSSPDQDR